MRSGKRESRLMAPRNSCSSRPSPCVLFHTHFCWFARLFACKPTFSVWKGGILSPLNRFLLNIAALFHKSVGYKDAGIQTHLFVADPLVSPLHTLCLHSSAMSLRNQHAAGSLTRPVTSRFAPRLPWVRTTESCRCELRWSLSRSLCPTASFGSTRMMTQRSDTQFITRRVSAHPKSGSFIA